MDSKEFRKRGTEMVEYICQYLETLEERRVTPSVEPGYLRSLIPAEAPNSPEPWEKIMDDVETKIMPGMKQMKALKEQHLNFFGTNRCHTLATSTLPCVFSVGKLFSIHLR